VTVESLPPPPLSIEEMVERKTVLMHHETGTIGRAVKFFDGVSAIHRGLDGNPVKAPVIELDTGDVFFVGPDAFTPLSPREVEMWTSLTSMVNDAVTIGIRGANAARIPLAAAAAIAGAVLRVQGRILEAAALKEMEKNEPPTTPPDAFG
jgi:hypothetical protein